MSLVDLNCNSQLTPYYFSSEVGIAGLIAGGGSREVNSSVIFPTFDLSTR